MEVHRWFRWLCASLAALTVLTAGAAPRAAAAEQAAVKGIYVSAWSAADPETFGELLELIDQTELNAVVVDVKDDSGRITFAVDEAVAREAGAVQPFIRDIRTFTENLRQRSIYSIARIVTFKDPAVAPHRPDWAAADVSGTVWRDDNGVAWLNPYSQDAWDYVVRIAVAAAEAGFDEIQFDYVRFPTDGRLSNLRYPGKDDRAPQQVIADFLAYARAQLKPYGVPVSADVFGLVTSAGDDMGIGQRLEEIAAAVDFVSPMLYPSHYERGNLGVANPNAMPYETVYRSLRDARRRIEAAGLTGRTAVRPWLQDFSWGHKYGPDEVRAQIQATYDAGYTQWLLWNAASHYTAAALKPAAPWPAHVLRPAEVGEQVTVALNGQDLVNPYQDVSPFVARSTSRTLMPLRAVSEALGATVAWNDEARRATVTWNGRQVEVTLASAKARVDGAEVELDQAALLWQDRVVVPLRFLAEAFGAGVAWDEERQRVLLSLPGAVCQPEYCGE